MSHVNEIFKVAQVFRKAQGDLKTTSTLYPTSHGAV